jgi:hypothetical protein
MRALNGDLGVNEMIISNLISNSSLYEPIDWNHMTKDREQWQVFVKKAKKPRDLYTVLTICAVATFSTRILVHGANYTLPYFIYFYSFNELGHLACRSQNF